MFTRKFDAIISNVNKAIAQLQALSEEQTEKARVKADRLDVLNQEIDEHHSEALRADRVAGRLQELIQ